MSKQDEPNPMRNAGNPNAQPGWSDTTCSGLPFLFPQQISKKSMRVHESFLSQNIFCDSKKIFCDLSVEMELENEKTTSTHIPNKENKNVDVHFATKTGKQN